MLRTWLQPLKQNHARRLFSSAVRRPAAALDRRHGFSLLGKKFFEERNFTAYLWDHDRTGAKYLHVEKDDENNAFSIGFKTNPPDNTGVPHILEHLVLCGSKKCVFSSRQIADADNFADTRFATPSSRCCLAPSRTL